MPNLLDIFGSQPQNIFSYPSSGKFRPSKNKFENENTKALANHLRKQGRIVKEQPRIPGGRPDWEESIHILGNHIFEGVGEAKQSLTSQSTLRDLKDQVTRYTESRRYVGGQIRIYRDTRADLYEELQDFCNRLSIERSLPFGIQIKVDGDIL